jgi:hypothetical protein
MVAVFPKGFSTRYGAQVKSGMCLLCGGYSKQRHAPRSKEKISCSLDAKIGTFLA